MRQFGFQRQRRNKFRIQAQSFFDRRERFGKLLCHEERVGFFVSGIARRGRRGAEQDERERQNGDGALPCGHGLTSSTTSTMRSAATFASCWTPPPGQRISIFPATRFEPSPNRTRASLEQAYPTAVVA